jgi:hypothetical protein
VFVAKITAEGLAEGLAESLAEGLAKAKHSRLTRSFTNDSGERSIKGLAKCLTEEILVISEWLAEDLKGGLKQASEGLAEGMA